MTKVCLLNLLFTISIEKIQTEIPTLMVLEPEQRFLVSAAADLRLGPPSPFKQCRRAFMSSGVAEGAESGKSGLKVSHTEETETTKTSSTVAGSSELKLAFRESRTS